MRPGSVIVDLGAEGGGNCELTRAGETVDVGGVSVDRAARRAVVVAGARERALRPQRRQPADAHGQRRRVRAGLGRRDRRRLLRHAGRVRCCSRERDDAGVCSPSSCCRCSSASRSSRRCRPILHTPLMSGANAIHGVILVGAIIVLGTGHGAVQTRARLPRGGARDHQRRRRLRRHRPDAGDVQGPPRRRSDAEADVNRLDTIELIYLLCAVCFIVALKGLSSPRWARQGNLDRRRGHGRRGRDDVRLPRPASHRAHRRSRSSSAIAAGWPAARLVKMTAIPQMVAAFNGVGGGAAALVSLAEFDKSHSVASTGTAAAVSVQRAGRRGVVQRQRGDLREAAGADDRAVRSCCRSSACSTPGSASPRSGWSSGGSPPAASRQRCCCASSRSVFGVLFVLPVGGADVPVVISLLNAFTGLAVAASGAVLRMTLLIVAGTLVGASGTLLTQLMAKAMGRPLTSILFGAITAKPTTGAVEGARRRPVGAHRHRRRRRGAARLRAPGRRRTWLWPGRRAGAAHRARARRAARAARRRGASTASIRSPGACPGT